MVPRRNVTTSNAKAGWPTKHSAFFANTRALQAPAGTSCSPWTHQVPEIGRGEIQHFTCLRSASSDGARGSHEDLQEDLPPKGVGRGFLTLSSRAELVELLGCSQDEFRLRDANFHVAMSRGMLKRQENQLR